MSEERQRERPRTDTHWQERRNSAAEIRSVGRAEDEGGANPRRRTAPRREQVALNRCYFFSNCSFRCLAQASAVVCCPWSVFFLFTA